MSKSNKKFGPKFWPKKFWNKILIKSRYRTRILEEIYLQYLHGMQLFMYDPDVKWVILITWLDFTRDKSFWIVKNQTWPVWLISVGNIPDAAFLEFLEFSSTVVCPDSDSPEFNWLSNKNFSIFSSRPVALTRFQMISEIL